MLSYKLVDAVLSGSRSRGTDRAVLVTIAEAERLEPIGVALSVEEIAVRTGVGRSTAYRSLRRLRDVFGELEVAPGGGRGQVNRYRVVLSKPSQVETVSPAGNRPDLRTNRPDSGQNRPDLTPPYIEPVKDRKRTVDPPTPYQGEPIKIESATGKDNGGTPDLASLWGDVVAACRETLGPMSTESWIAPLEVVALGPDAVGVHGGREVRWVRDQYGRALHRAATDVLGREARLEFDVAEHHDPRGVEEARREARDRRAVRRARRLPVVGAAS